MCSSDLNYNFAGAIAAEASLGLLHRVGAREIEQHVRGLAARLASGLADLGLPLIGPPSGPTRGSIVCIGKLGDGGHDSTDDADLSALHRVWHDAGVRLSIRRGLLRLSLHAYNNIDDIDTVLDLTRAWKRTSGSSR